MHRRKNQLVACVLLGAMLASPSRGWAQVSFEIGDDIGSDSVVQVGDGPTEDTGIEPLEVINDTQLDTVNVEDIDPREETQSIPLPQKFAYYEIVTDESGDLPPVQPMEASYIQPPQVPTSAEWSPSNLAPSLPSQEPDIDTSLLIEPSPASTPLPHTESVTGEPVVTGPVDKNGNLWLEYCDQGCDCGSAGSHCHESRLLGGDCEPCIDLCSGCRGFRTRLFGEFLYVRPRNAEVAYAVPINGADLQVGPIGLVDPEFEPAFRVGFELPFDDLVNVGGTFTHYESSTSDQISTGGQDIVRSLLIHPSTRDAQSDGTEASALYDINYQLADLVVRQSLLCDGSFHSSWFLGGRYARLEQELQSTSGVGGIDTVRSDIDFEGGGLRIGLDASNFGPRKIMFFYAGGSAGFVAGRFRANYQQTRPFDPVLVDTSWDAGRVITTLDFQAGVGFASRDGRIRVSGGYVVSAWLNAVKANEFVSAVQSNRFQGMDDNLTFDGLVARVELRF